MGHEFIRRHVGGHLYNDNGIGEREIDLTPFLDTQVVVESFKLPGFVDTARNVTYKSHDFWFHFLKGKNFQHVSGHTRVLVVVHHGGGWEVWEGDSMLATALFAMVSKGESMYRPAFLLAWSLIDIAEGAHTKGVLEASERFKKAFVHGWLKKRKQRGTNSFKVWIDDPNQK